MGSNLAGCQDKRCLDTYEWEQWVPLKEIAPEFGTEECEGARLLYIKGTGADTTYGKWVTRVTDVSGGQAYSFSAEYLAKNVESETLSVQAILTWRKKDGKLLQRDYTDKVSPLSDGWKKMCRLITAPCEAEILDVELVLRYPAYGEVYFRNPVLEKAPAEKPRKVRIASPLVLLRKNLAEHSPENNMKFNLDLIDKAAKLGPDVICLTEKTVEDCLEYLPLSEIADTVPGERTAIFAEKARQYNCYIIYSMVEKEGGNYYNTAVLIDRNGEVVGKYRKTHLPLSEAETGFAPGKEYPVFDTDFGRIGIMICWDQVFPEVARILAMKGAEIIFIPTHGDALIQQQARAIDNGVYIVSCGIYRPTSSRIINPVGEILAVADEEHNHIAFAEIDLNEKFYKYWMSVGPCDGEPRTLYVRERRPETYGDIVKDA